MKAIATKFFLTFSAIFALITTKSTLAATEINIDSDTLAFQNKELVSGSVKVLVDYAGFDNKQFELDDPKNLTYQIYYNGVIQTEGSSFTVYTGNISLKDLDANGITEVIITTFSGGAHCCTNHVIYTWQEKQFTKIETGYSDGTGGAFEDLNGDGKYEFLTYDNSFLYMFSSYAGSFPPSLIYSFQNGKLENVTRQNQKQLRSVVKQMYQAFLQSKQENGEVNGILAGYVAQKILLDEYEDGWKFMLANYDRTSDWGLEIYEGDRQVGTYPDFPTALKAFLIKEGYLAD
jgi:hypothetical protein